ncbi:hypothetical protein M0R04_07770 [Candidatus Dojkabacteria bacterium]|jgi:hypothetical protein|nr:hypothetical protein [Candidatus Dojkabacteria bacterium]
MLLKEIKEEEPQRYKPDWTEKTEKEQIAIVNNDGFQIRNISNPSLAVQIAAVHRNPIVIRHLPDSSEVVQLSAIADLQGWAIQFIHNPTTKVLLTALKDLKFIKDEEEYETFIKQYFANNTLLMKKWLRYGQAMRES